MVPKNLKFLLALIIVSKLFSSEISSNNIKSSSMVNLGFFNMFKSKEFEEPFSAGIYNNKTYYHMPSNSWNDLFYIILRYDRKLKKLKLRGGWELELNFSGSGDSKGEACKIEKDTDLGKTLSSELYANFVDHKLTFYLTLFYIKEFKFLSPYTGFSAGACIGWFTYNEIAYKEISQAEIAYRDTFIKILPALKIYFGTVIKISDNLNDLFIEGSFKYSYEPILKYSLKERYIKFQISGFMLGAGFRY